MSSDVPETSLPSAQTLGRENERLGSQLADLQELYQRGHRRWLEAETDLGLALDLLTKAQDLINNTHLDIVFTEMPGPDNECVFVEVECDGRSVKVGEWITPPDGYATLRITPADFEVCRDR